MVEDRNIDALRVEAKLLSFTSGLFHLPWGSGEFFTSDLFICRTGVQSYPPLECKGS